jgi:hypothetical protein
VSGYSWVSRNEGDFLALGLSNKEAIERIALVVAVQLHIGKLAISLGMAKGDRQNRKALCQELLCPVFGDFQLAQRGFDHHLKKGSRAEQRLLGTGYRFPCPDRESRVITQPPQSGMGVDQQPQSIAPRLRATSSGQVSKSSAIEI